MLKYTKFDFGWGSAPDPAGGAYSAAPDPLAGFGGPTSKKRRGERKGRRKEGKGKGHEHSIWRKFTPMPVSGADFCQVCHGHNEQVRLETALENCHRTV